MTHSQALCDASNSQLVHIDIQEKLGAVMPEKVLRRVVKHSSLLASTSALLNVPNIITRQYPKGLGDVLPELRAVIPDQHICFDKTGFSCTSAEHFIDSLTRDQVILTGMESHICILQTALELTRIGKQVFVVADAVCSRRLENYHNALERLQQADVVVTSTESVIFEWLRDARHEQFRAVAEQVK